MSSFSEQMVTMFKFDDRHHWLRDADLTYCAARQLLLCEDVFFRSPVGYLLHQAVEKYLKTLRKVLSPDIPERQGSHNLCALHSDVKNQKKLLDVPEVKNAISDLNTFQHWRYQDRPSNQTRKAMDDGLASADLVVARVRTEIPIEIRFQGLYRILQLSGIHGELLLNALLVNNFQRAHWKSDLLGISEHLDGIIKTI
ncbi:MAG: HEPN domain-containing protein [Nitrospira sp.]|nr:HEPN domain-containing protein [Nitrospira sp.]